MLKWFITSSVLILAVVLIRRFSRGKASARAIYALWLLVALRLLIPGSIGESHASVTAVVERTAGEAALYEALGRAYREQRRYQTQLRKGACLA